MAERGRWQIKKAVLFSKKRKEHECHLVDLGSGLEQDPFIHQYRRLCFRQVMHIIKG